MRQSAPACLALLPLLLLGTAACTEGSGGTTLAPAAAPAVPVDDGVPGGDAEEESRPASGRSGAAAAHVGDPVRISGRKVGRHLQAVLDAYVDPAVSLDKEFGPPAGKRWVGAGMTFVNVGGDTYGSLGRMWALDSAGRRYPSVPAGELTTGKPIVFDSLEVGDRLEGWVVFEVPENAAIVRLQYQDANTRSNAGEGFWEV
ncbi:hypothetical protein [Streptomyces sp. NPDC012888]|uniref:hypothetical protein n=1 Tax=Streptomyces sp. NPDC012888 TaxID=3364855 RepID=UPI003699CFDC